MLDTLFTVAGMPSSDTAEEPHQGGPPSGACLLWVALITHLTNYICLPESSHRDSLQTIFQFHDALAAYSTPLHKDMNAPVSSTDARFTDVINRCSRIATRVCSVATFDFFRDAGSPLPSELWLLSTSIDDRDGLRRMRFLRDHQVPVDPRVVGVAIANYETLPNIRFLIAEMGAPVTDADWNAVLAKEGDCWHSSAFFEGPTMEPIPAIGILDAMLASGFVPSDPYGSATERSPAVQFIHDRLGVPIPEALPLPGADNDDSDR